MAHQHSTPRSPQPEWLTLTDLGRLYGISAMHCGRLLHQAGLRSSDGEPTLRAIKSGCAAAPPERRHGQQPCWHRSNCREAFESAGLVTVQRDSLVQQWANLLSALNEGSPSINTSADQMAEELPGELVEPVNRQLREIGCSFQVRPSVPGCASVEPTAGGTRHGAARRRGLIGNARRSG